MNATIDRLFKAALKPSRLIIGLMSGTSLDGLDIALCRCTGSGTGTNIKILQFETIAYDSVYRQEIKSVFSKKVVDLEKVCLLNGWVAVQHANMVNDCLKKWNIDPHTVDLIASHGQTIYHAPKYLHPHDQFSNGTLQIGDGDHLAVKTGIITISDFRQKNIAAGGEGAPLAAYGDYLLFNKKGENRILLNIGGIANFTLLPGGQNPGGVFSTDTGPGNALMDAYVQQHFSDLHFDDQSAVARSGLANEPLLAGLKQHDFFENTFPKTTGPELFNIAYIENATIATGVADLSHGDMMATLNRFSADTIATAIQHCSVGLKELVIFISGGGIHNPLLIQNIKAQLPDCNFKTTGLLGINPDAKEAVLFALLANETVAGAAMNAQDGRGPAPSISMGKISFPS